MCVCVCMPKDNLNCYPSDSFFFLPLFLPLLLPLLLHFLPPCSSSSFSSSSSSFLFFPSSSSPSFFFRHSLFLACNSPSSLDRWSAHLRDYLSFPLLIWDDKYVPLLQAFFLSFCFTWDIYGFWVLNSGPPACKPSTLQREPSSKSWRKMHWWSAQTRHLWPAERSACLRVENCQDIQYTGSQNPKLTSYTHNPYKIILQ